MELITKTQHKENKKLQPWSLQECKHGHCSFYILFRVARYILYHTDSCTLVKYKEIEHLFIRSWSMEGSSVQTSTGAAQGCVIRKALGVTGKVCRMMPQARNGCNIKIYTLFSLSGC